MSTISDASFNAGLVAYNTLPLKQALLEFGQPWLIDALGPDLDPGGVLSFVNDWGLGPTPQAPAPFPYVAPELKARMIAYAVAVMSNTPLSAAAAGAVSGYPITLPAYFRTQATDNELWSGYKSSLDFTFHDALRLWSRRVALSLTIDGANLVPWRLRDFPAWQVVQMLSWQPTTGNRLKDVLEGTWRGYSPLTDGNGWFTFDYVWAPDPLVEHLAAKAIVEDAGATSPRQALLAIRTWMAQKRALHGQQEWTYFWGNGAPDQPPGGPLENNCNPKHRYDQSMAQWLRLGWGGCPSSSSALTLLLLSINIPAAAIVGVVIDLVGKADLVAPVGAWSTSRRKKESVPVRVVLGAQGSHVCCYVFGAGLACAHGDYNVCGAGDGVAFGDNTLSGWLPWRLQLAMHVWAEASSPKEAPAPDSPPNDDFFRRVLLIDGLRSAASDADFAPSFLPFLPALEGSAATAIATNWLANAAAGMPPSLRQWIVAVSFWPVGRKAPGLRGHRVLVEQACRVAAGGALAAAVQLPIRRDEPRDTSGARAGDSRAANTDVGARVHRVRCPCPRCLRSGGQRSGVRRRRQCGRAHGAVRDPRARGPASQVSFGNRKTSHPGRSRIRHLRALETLG